MEPSIERLHDLIIREAPGLPVAMYVTGSYCDGGLRPDSDLDFLLITRDSLTLSERGLLVEHLLAYSGKQATGVPGRPVELISLVLDDITPWRYPATRDFLYGEWLRADYEAGFLPAPVTDPNLPVVLTSARRHSQALFGPPLAEVVDPVPEKHLAQSMFDALPSLVDDLVGDERNVLLTLARMLYTLRTGLIAPKDVAADVVGATLGPDHARILDLAAKAYRGEVQDHWALLHAEVAATVEVLTDLSHTLHRLRTQEVVHHEFADGQVCEPDEITRQPDGELDWTE